MFFLIFLEFFIFVSFMSYIFLNSVAFHYLNSACWWIEHLNYYLKSLTFSLMANAFSVYIHPLRKYLSTTRLWRYFTSPSRNFQSGPGIDKVGGRGWVSLFFHIDIKSTTFSTTLQNYFFLITGVPWRWSTSHLSVPPLTCLFIPRQHLTVLPLQLDYA